MKKRLINVALVGLMLSGCNNKKVEYDLTIVSPTGAPAVAFYNFSDYQGYETNSTPTNITNMMVAGSKDVIVIDIFSGVNQIKNGASYSLAAGLTFGNFFLYATANAETLNITSSSKIYSFGEGQNPDKTFKALFPEATNIEYATNGAAGTRPVMCTGKAGNVDYDFIFTAQPILQSVLSDSTCTTAKKYFSIQDKYEEIFGTKGFPQAGLFIKNSVLKDKKSEANQFLKDLKKDIEDGIKNPELIETGMNKYNDSTTLYGVAPALAKAVTTSNNGLGLGFKYGKDMKDDIASYFTNIGVTLVTEDSYFYKP